MGFLLAGGGTSRKLSQAPRAKELQEKHLDLSFMFPFQSANNNLVVNPFRFERVLVLMRSLDYMSVEFEEVPRIQRTDDHFRLEYFPFPCDPLMVELRASSKIPHATYDFCNFQSSYTDC